MFLINILKMVFFVFYCVIVTFAEELLKHEVRVLMTRGVNGVYIYACDDELREALLNAAK